MNEPTEFRSYFLRLEDVGVGSFITRVHTDVGPGWWLFQSPVQTLSTCDPGGVIMLLEKVERWTKEGGWAAGYVSYEAASAFDSAYETYKVDPISSRLTVFQLFDHAPRLFRELEPVSAVERIQIQPNIAEAEFFSALKEIREALASGRTYQTNFTFRLAGEVKDPLRLFFSLVGTDPPPYATYMDSGEQAFASFSPELFFSREGSQITCRPMKGTAPRVGDPAEDAATAQNLRSNEKERAENLMIVDMIRNDLGRIAKPGSVMVPDLFTVESHRSILQMTSTVQAETSEDLAGVFRALFPCASVTGAPKVETMRLIKSLETSPRGVYTGALGWVGPNDVSRFSVAIRTLVVDRPCGAAIFGVGSGIVWDSDPAAEWEECRLKTAVLSETPTAWELLETMLWSPEDGVTLLEEHLDRMSASSARLYLPFNRDSAIEALRSDPDWNSPMRIRLTMGINGTFARTFRRYREKPGPITAVISRRPMASGDPALGIKSTARRLYDSHLEENPGVEEVLLINERGELTEFILGNLVLDMGGSRFTPPLSCGILPGVMRGALLELKQLEEAVLYAEDLSHAEAVWRINSVSGFSRVRFGALRRE